MPKKIDDILNPKPPPTPEPPTPPVEDTIIRVLTDAKEKGTALTEGEILAACQFDWTKLIPVGKGGLFVQITTDLLGHAIGTRKIDDDGRSAALKRLVDAGRVVEREDEEGVVYYWLA
jgi:hypothetical protein